CPGWARAHARVAAGAAVDVHRHAPPVLRVLDGGIHRRMARVLGCLAAQLELTRRAEPHPLGDLAIILVETRRAARGAVRPCGAPGGARTRTHGPISQSSGLSVASGRAAGRRPPVAASV